MTRSVTSSTVPSAGVRDARDGQRHQITEAVLLLGDDEEPGQQVLHDALRAEAERGAEHRGGRDQRSHWYRDDVGDLHRDDHEQDRHRHPRDHRCHGLAVFGALGADQLVAFPVLRVDAPDDPVGEPVDEPGGQQAADQQ